MKFSDYANISAPGVGTVTDNIIVGKLSPDYRINRLSFDFINPVKMDKNSSLEFQIKFDNPSDVELDILKGDVGLPEISFISQFDEVYRLKRGNFKDFFDRKRVGEWQLISIPLSILIYHVDLKNNIQRSGEFFDSNIKKVAFDFLSGSKPIGFSICDVFVKESDNNLLGLDCLLEIERVGDTKFYEKFVSEGPSISLSLLKNDVARIFFPGEISVKVKGEGFEKEVKVNKTKTYFSLPLKKFGDNVFKLTGECSKGEFGYDLCVTKTISKQKELNRFVGFSDEFRVEKCFALGSGSFRIVVNLRAVIKEGLNFRFPVGKDPFSLLSRPDIEYWISLKGLPSWLSRKPNATDAYRYGPNDYDNYKSLMKWVFSKAKEAGVKVVELWNEANVIHEWNDSFEILSEMCRVSKQARDEVYPKCELASPSSTSWDFDYFDKLARYKVYDSVEYLAMHAYSYQPEKIHEQFQKLEYFIKKQDRMDLKVAITEIGFRVPAFSPKEQAQCLFMYSLFAYVYKFISNIFWFRIENPRFESTSSYDQNSSGGYALLGYNGSFVRPTYSCFRFLSFLLYDLPEANIKTDGSHIEINLKSESSSYRLIFNLSDHPFESIEPATWIDCFGNELSSEEALREKIIISKGSK